MYFVHNFSDVRAAIDVKFNGKLIPNDTIPSNPADYYIGQNLVRNITDLGSKEEQLLSFIVNGKNNTKWKESTLTFTGHRCIGPCNEDINETTTLGPERLWSNPASWQSGEVPKADEDVHIESGWDMIYDIEGETPIYRLIRVNGRLTFKNDLQNTTLHAKHIFIRAGELHIGNKTNPFLGNCTIMLHGEKDAKAIVYDNAIEAGNKLIANLNIMRIYGKQRSHHFSRLLREAKKGENKILIEKGMDITPGDRLALLPTSFDNIASDDVYVTSYDNETGETGLDRKLDYYHWGAQKSQKEKYNGADMRGEVLLLTRNIVIRGEDIESWGGQIVTSDTVEINTLGQMAVRSGSTVMENVEVYNCS